MLPFTSITVLYRVYLKRSNKFQKRVLHTRKKFISMFVHKQFPTYNPTTCWIQSFKFFICGDKYSACCVQVELKVKRHFANASFMSIRTSATPPGPLKTCHGPWSDVSTRAIIQEESVLCVCYELLVINNNNLTAIKLGTCTENVLSVVSEILC
jgi:hypothetical protein